MGSTKKRQYLETHEELAAYLGMSVPELLKLEIRGMIGFRQRPINPAMAWFTSDVDRWLANGRPVANIHVSDPSGVAR